MFCRVCVDFLIDEITNVHLELLSAVANLILTSDRHRCDCCDVSQYNDHQLRSSVKYASRHDPFTRYIAAIPRKTHDVS